ncbi:MAG: glycyl-radical enzyme activating protein [Bacteroides sp.]|uniref:glycyl-radical enzyme activating protein n=1 Tax=Bacteroides sp. TaxID=29523 RepID=UPI002FC891BC
MRIKISDRNNPKGSCTVRLFDVAEFSPYDGPGTRTVVYFQGCNAHCAWCHSPQSQPGHAPLLFNTNVCARCQRCVSACPSRVHSFSQGIHHIDRTRCNQCGACIEQCPNSIAGVRGSALHLPTAEVSVSSLFEQIDPYIRLNGKNGGITLSGGEALLQPEAAEELLRSCKQRGYHTAIETSGLLSLATYERVLPLVDLWLFGMRIITHPHALPHHHHIKEVLGLLIRNNASVLPRIPMIPSYFDRDDVLQSIASLLAEHSLTTVSLMPWNRNYAICYTESGIPLQMQPPSSTEIELCESKITSFFNNLTFKLYEHI